MPKYTYGNVTFGSFLAKEHWILRMNIDSLEFIKNHGHVTHPSDRQHLISTIKTLKAQEKRIRKQLIKDGYLKA